MIYIKKPLCLNRTPLYTAIPKGLIGKGDLFMMRYTRFEKARIIGARALQISLGAPILVDLPNEKVDPLELSLTEFDKGFIPITVRRPTIESRKWD